MQLVDLELGSSTTSISDFLRDKYYILPHSQSTAIEKDQSDWYLQTDI